MVIGIIGGTIYGNRGAEAMLVTTIGQVRERHPNATIIIFSYLPAEDRERLQDSSIEIIDSRPQALVFGHFLGLFLATKSARAIRRCDLLLDVSGISFADGREKFLPFNVLVMWPALLFGVPVVKLAQAVGPFKNPLNRFVSKRFLSRCRKVYARGKITADYIRDLGLPDDRWDTAADIAFLYRPEYNLSIENPYKVTALVEQLASIRAEGRMVIGLSPSSLVYQKSRKNDRDYVGQFLKLIRNLDASYHYVLLPNATRAGTDKPRNNDLYVIDQIAQRAKRELSREMQQRLHVVDFDLNTDGSRQLIRQCDLLVTSRFHGMISALSLTVPVMVIGWSHKYAEVLAEFGLEDFAVDFNDPTLDMQAMINDLVARKDAVQAQLTDGLARVRAQAEKQFTETLS